MPYANQVVLTGHLARDPELRYGKSGTGYTKFTLAVSREYGDDETDFINCVAFDRGNYKLAEYVANDTGKGKLVTVFGRLQIDKWQDDDGNNRRKEQIICDKVVYEKDKSANKAEKQDDDSEFNVPF